MKGITKLALFLVALVGILQSLIVLAYFWPLRPLNTWLNRYATITRWSIIGMSAVVCGLCAVLLLIAVFRRSTVNELIIKNDRGHIQLSKTAIEKGIAALIVAKCPVRSVDVALKMHRNFVGSARVTISLVDQQQVTNIGQSIENTVKARLHELLDLDVKRVDVKILSPQQLRQQSAKVL